MSDVETVKILLTALSEVEQECQMEYAAAIRHAIDVIVQNEADGCVGCAFEDREEWEMPCKECKNSKRNYWRARKAT